MSAQLQFSLAARQEGWRNPRSATRGRVLLVSPQPFYEDRGTPIAVELVSRSLAARGYDVDLLAFPIGQEVQIPGVTVHRSSRLFGIRSVPIGFSLGKLALDAGLFNKFRRMLDSGGYDVVHAVEEAAYFAAMLCPSRRIPFIYDMASAIPAELEHHCLLGTRLVQGVMKSAERRVLKNASHVFCSMGLASRVRKIAPETPVAEWRFPAPDMSAAPGTVVRLRERLGIGPDEFVLLYAGNFSSYQGLGLLIEAFKLAACQHPRLTLVCLGAKDTDTASQWRGRLPADIRARAHILPRIPRSDVPNYLAAADCLVSLRPAGDNAPLKIFEYMAAGRPILATRGRAHELVLSADTAFLCDCSAMDIAARLSDLMTNPERAGQLAESARRLAKRQYSRERFDKLLRDVYQEFETLTLPWAYWPRPAPP